MIQGAFALKKAFLVSAHTKETFKISFKKQVPDCGLNNIVD
jgi:hypothetical protein